TGISTRLFAARGVHVIGVEPNDDMRARAEAVPGARYQKGTAEATELDDGCATAGLAGQAFHWFDARAALRGVHRSLRPGGGVAPVWTEREERDPCTATYGEVMRTGPDAASVEGPRLLAGEALLHSPLFVEAHKVTFAHEQAVDEDGLLGRAFSAS